MHEIVSNHGFVDGNKRTAFYLTELPVQRSGYILTASDEAMAGVIPSFARGEMSLEELAAWLKGELILPSRQ
ncbi:MAG: type II toxin-antitoxin system death-on-curing family toxin [Bacteroidota bacterium]|nr:type II toxin-antitoxin system death-on-curing family toxin [Bacteroidota bacterium]